MEIRVEEPGAEQRTIAVTMRTPGNDFELAVGFLFTEGLIAGADEVRTVRYCAVPREEQHYNVVSVAVTRVLDAAGAERNFYATSSCGVCGKASLLAVGNGTWRTVATFPLGAPAEVQPTIRSAPA